MIAKNDQVFKFSFKNNNNKLQQINKVKLGVFQQIIFKYDFNQVRVQWYQDFQIIYQHEIFTTIQNTKIINKQDFIFQQQIQNNQIDQFIANCRDSFNIRIQLHPQIRYHYSEYFNNNYYKISFWIKQQKKGNQINIQILDKFQGKRILIIILWQYLVLIYDEISQMKDNWNTNEWMLFQFTYNNLNGILKYQRDQYVYELQKPQKFQYQVRFQIEPHKNFIIAEILLQISQHANKILCVPGCLKCNQDGYCLQCDIGHVKQGNYCECQKDYKYLFSPSECYIKLDYKIIQANKTRNCPTFGGQRCPQCEDDRNLNFTFCLFASDIHLYSDQLELDFNYYHLFIYYKLIDNDYQIDLNALDLQTNYHNLIYYKQSDWDVFMIGLNKDKNKVCFNSYYYNSFCKKQIKWCKIQLQNHYCTVCLQRHFLLNGKCKKYPAFCEFCKIINDQILCIKCVKNYFLNFQRKCIICQLQYCEQCYHYNGNQNTLELNFKIQSPGFEHQLGCSYCSDDNVLQIEQRKCVQQKWQNIMNLNSRIYEDNPILSKFINQLINQCEIEIPKCYLCQYKICLQCIQNFILDFKLNLCLPNQNDLQLQNANLNLQDYELFHNLVTFLYFNYSYIDIRLQQEQYYIQNCQFNNFADIDQIQNVQCDKEMSYLTNFQKEECPFYCQSCLNNKTCLNYKYMIDFTFNLTGLSINNNFELLTKNSYINNIELINTYQLNTNTLNIQINQVSPSFFKYPANIPYHPQGFNVNLQFTNASLLNDEYLYFEEPINIIDSQFNVFKDLRIDINFISKKQFILRNVQFTGKNNESGLELNINCSQFKLENVTIYNFSQLHIVIYSQDLQIENLNLINLQITDKNFNINIIQIETEQFILKGLIVYKCQIHNISFFDISYNSVEIQSIQLFCVLLRGSRLFFFYQQQKKYLNLSHIYLKQIISYDSQLFVIAIINSDQLFISSFQNLIISESTFIDSFLLLSQSTIIVKTAMTFIKLYLKNNTFNNSILIFYQSVFINVTQILIQDNNLENTDFFIQLQAEDLHLSKVLYQYNLNPYGRFLNLVSQYRIQVNQILIKNCSFISQNPVKINLIIRIISQESLIDNIYFIDINTSVSLMAIQAKFGQLDNIQLFNVQMTVYLQFILSIFYDDDEKQNKIRFKNLILDNISIQELQRDAADFIQIIQIKNFIFQLQNIFVSNILTKEFNLITVFKSFQFYVTNLQAQNLTISCLIYSGAKNIFDQFYLQKIFAFQSLLIVESIDKQEQKLSNIQIHESDVTQGFIKFYSQGKFGFGSISLINFIINQINSKRIMDFLTQQTMIYIKNMHITQSNLKQIIFSQGTQNQVSIQIFKVQNVSFEFDNQFSFILPCNKVKLSDILFARTSKLTFLITSKKFQINNLMFLNSEIIYISLQQQHFNNITNQQMINNIYLINNVFYLLTNLKALALLQLKNDIVQINGFHIYNNTISDESTLLQLQAKFIIEASIINNKCGQQCIDVEKNSQIKFNQLNMFRNEFISSSPLNVHLSSSVINFTLESASKNKLAIQINEIKIIKEFKLNQILFLPSGQNLTEYKIFDYKNIRLKQQLYNITIINYNNLNSEMLKGAFSIKVYEFDQINNLIVNDLSQFQNFQVFEQSYNHSGLNNFQIIYNPYQKHILLIEIQKIDNKQQQLKIFAKTQLCQMGEILIQNQCLVCNPILQIYSLKQKSNFCQIVDKQIISDHLQGAIKLRKGYWRPFIYNSFIELCDAKFDKCNGGWHTGDVSCQTGYIGAICNSCDIYNTRGNGYYLLEQKECKLCGDFKYFRLVFKLVFILLILCLRLILSLNSNVQNYKKLLLQRLVNNKNFHILAKYISDIPSLIFTILIGNLAILKLIVQDSIELPDILTIFTNPIIIEQNSFLCIQQFINLDYNYWLYYFKLIIPILTYNMFVILMVITLDRKNIIKTYFLFPIISLFLSQGPTLLVLFLQQALYVSYSNVKYANFDFSIRYFGSGHQHNLKYVILPIIVLLNAILPFTLMILIKKYAKNILKDKFIQMGNFILPFKSNYQELFNYFRNSILLLVLSLNDKQLSYHDKTLLITLMYISFTFEIYKIKLLSLIAQQSARNLIWILCYNYVFKQNQFSFPVNILIILTALFILIQLKVHVQMLFNQNKVLIFESFSNRRILLKYLGLKNYNQCLYCWKLIKQNHKLLVQKKIKFQISNKEESINDIILKTVKTQMTNNSLIEIEMMQL